jgi:uncharacterized membrane protein YfcA
LALPSLPLALLLAVLIGASLGLLGSGGSIVMLPVLVYVAGVPVNEAVPLSLAVVAATSAVGALAKSRRGAVDWPAALAFAVAGAAGAFPGALLTHRVPESLLTLLFAALMLLVGLRMLLSRSPAADPPLPPSPWAVLATGLGIGFLTGFLGVGGGFLIVPALVVLMGMDMHRATGTSLVVIVVNSLSGLLGHLSRQSFPWWLAGQFLAAGLVGIVASTWLAFRVGDQPLRRAFGAFVMAIGGAILVDSIV